MADQFDPRYKIDPSFVPDPGAKKRSKYVVSRQKEIMSRIRLRPGNIAFFEALLDNPPVEKSKPSVGYFCNMIPVELIRAFGATPIRLGCGNAALVQTGEEVLTGDICPLCKASFAQFLDDANPALACDCLVIPTSCDAKKKLGEILADIMPVFMLPLPVEQDYARHAKQAVSGLERLSGFLAKHLGTKLSKTRLLDEIALSNERTVLVRELLSERAQKPAALSVRDLYIVIQSSFTGIPLDKWLEQAFLVLGDVKSFVPDRVRMRPRIVLTGAPVIWPNFKILNLIEECGADVVADTMCTGSQSVYDPIVVDEKNTSGLFRALAQRYFFASPCPCFVSQGKRLTQILELAEQYNADGVVHYGLRLCQLFDMETYRLSRVLREKKVPFINLSTDYSLEDTEQLRVRLEAFLETVGDD